MTILESELFDISAGLLVCAAGVLAFAIAFSRLKNRDFTLLNFGLFAFSYGLRLLVESQTMRTIVGFPFTSPFFHGLLTFALVIPLSALVVDIFGRGWRGSMVWVFRSTIIYAVGALAYNLLRPGPLTDVAIYQPLVVLWGLVWIANVLPSRRTGDVEVRVLQAVFLTTFVFMLIDQLISIRIVSWTVRLERPGFAVEFLGLGFVAVHHFFASERKLQSIEQEIDIARRIQESNLPANITVPGGIDIAAEYVPMSTVAGDFYDIQTDQDNGVGILIADVSGHGIGAALIGSMLKVGFASQASHIADPAHVLTEINRILQGKMKDSFVTACSLFIDFRKKVIRYSIAGHPPPFLRTTSPFGIVRLTRAGTIMGPFPDAVYVNDEVPLGKGDRLVLFTDGLVETRSKSGEFYGDQRLEALLKAHSDDSPKSAAHHMLEGVVAWSGGNSPDDDLTLIVADLLTEPPTPGASRE